MIRRDQSVIVRGVREIAETRRKGDDAPREKPVALWKVLPLPILPAPGTHVWISDPSQPLGLVLTVEDVRPCELFFTDGVDMNVALAFGSTWEVAFETEDDTRGAVARAEVAGWLRVVLPARAAPTPDDKERR